MAKVYEYKGVSYELPDGLTNEDALAKIKASLGGEEPTMAQPAEAPKEQGLGDLLRRQLGLATRAVVTGVSSPANMVTDFLSGAVNVGANLVGSDKRMPYLSKEQSKGLTQLGVPQPETGAERSAQVGMQALTSAGGMAAMAPKSIFGADLVRQLPAATVAPMVAQPVAEITKDVTGSDMAATIAALGVSGAVGKATGDISGRIATGKQPTTTMAEVQQRASRAYTKVSDQGIEISGKNATNLVDKIKARLDAVDYIPENAAPVANILNVAETKALNPTASESELIRQGFINLATNKNKMSLFNKDEQSAIKAVAKGSSLDPLLTLMAKFNPQRSQFMAGGAFAGSIAKPEIGIPIAAAGYGADKLQALLRRQSAEKAMSGLLTGTTPPPSTDYYTRGLMSSLMNPPNP